MKTLLNTLLIAGLLGTTSTAMANTSETLAGHAKWNGNTGNMSDICAFVGGTHTAGTMTYNETSGVWTTTTPAVVQLRTRGNNNLDVKAVKKLYQGSTEVEDVTVDYTAGSNSSVEKPDGSGSANINKDNITVSMNNTAGIVKFNIAGTATMPSDTDVVLSKNTVYTVKHKITCTQ